jgi:hypothetical protein
LVEIWRLKDGEVGLILVGELSASSETDPLVALIDVYGGIE